VRTSGGCATGAGIGHGAGFRVQVSDTVFPISAFPTSAFLRACRDVTQAQADAQRRAADDLFTGSSFRDSAAEASADLPSGVMLGGRRQCLRARRQRPSRK
jgi:hypothetical protein